MKLLLLLFGLVFGYNINYDLKLTNEYFYINYDDNSIILNNYYSDSYVKINFEYISESEGSQQNILFNTFIKETEVLDNFEYIRALMKNNNLYYEIIYESFYNKNYIDVYTMIKKNNTNINDETIICISFDRAQINYDGNYTLEVKDYIINFSNISFSDYKYNKVNLERFGNYFYIHFPSYLDYIQYTFTIKYEPNINTNINSNSEYNLIDLFEY